MTIEDKLKSFSEKVMAETEAKHAQITAERDAGLKAEVEEAERRERQKAEDELRLAEHRAAQERGRLVAAAALEAKKKLLTRRNEMIGELFDGVKKRLEEFTRSPDYAAYLTNEINTLAEGTPGLGEVRPCTDDMIGGFIAQTTGRGIIDHSFKSRLEREREKFNLFKI